MGGWRLVRKVVRWVVVGEELEVVVVSDGIVGRQ